jgi:hypothetical protein
MGSARMMTRRVDAVAALGICGAQGLELLKPLLESPEGASAEVARALAVALPAPELVACAAAGYARAKSPELKRSIIECLQAMALPEAKRALESLKEEDAELKRAIDEAAKGLSWNEGAALERLSEGCMTDAWRASEDFACFWAPWDRAEIRKNVFDALEADHGGPLSYILEAFVRNVRADDLPRLYELRRRIFYRLSDEGMYDVLIVNSAIRKACWRAAADAAKPSGK